MKKIAIALSMLLIAAGCNKAAPQPQSVGQAPAQQKENAMNISSPDFQEGGAIPAKFTCAGENINPELNFTGVPADARSLALIMDDPDAPMGTFVHWVIWNMPPNIGKISENFASATGVQGANGSGKNAYTGPCPPSGEHRYFFKLYALDTELTLAPETGKAGLEQGMQGHIIEEAQLMGKFSK